MSGVAMPQPEPAPDMILANARLVLRDEVLVGAVAVAGGRVSAIDPGAGVPPGAIDCAGALLMPGLIELHTDNLEKHLKPRPGVVWPAAAAVVAHDGEIAAAGVTTVFDAIRVGSLQRAGNSVSYMRYARDMADHIKRLVEGGALRIEHRIHLRAELCSETVLEEMDEFAGEALVKIVSVMDHTPGQRQFADEAKYRQYYEGKHGLSAGELDEFIVYTKDLNARLGETHEQGVVARARAAGAILASHDDMTGDQVARSLAHDLGFAEFPTTLEAARAYHAAGVPVMMGAPNLLRGGSHSGNVAAMELVEAGCLDMLSSDYAPSALLMAAMKLGRITGDVPGAIATVTRNPAQATRLDDRGEIAIGKRADLVLVREFEGMDLVAGVWCAGRKVG